MEVGAHLMMFGKANRSTRRRRAGRARTVGRRALTPSEVADNRRFLSAQRSGHDDRGARTS